MLTPYPTVQGQAGAQAIEDGAALGVVFSKIAAPDAPSIASRLKHFENIRRNRASVMQMLSNAGQDEAAKARESVLPYMPDGNIPSESVLCRSVASIFVNARYTANQVEYTEHNFKHDVFAACEAEMLKVDGTL